MGWLCYSLHIIITTVNRDIIHNTSYTHNSTTAPTWYGIIITKEFHCAGYIPLLIVKVVTLYQMPNMEYVISVCHVNNYTLL